MLPDVLAQAAPQALLWLWSPYAQVVQERKLWVAVLRAQTELGLPAPDGALEAYWANINRVDLESIRRRELVTRHDVKARIEEFNALAGYEVIHRGMTSADVVDNIAQFRVLDSMWCLVRMWPAVFGPLRQTMARYPLRGIKGPVGTQQDQLDLLGTPERVEQLERSVAGHLGFTARLHNVGQMYHRSLDISVATDVASCCFELCGSPEWPQRATGALLTGYLAMLAGYAGDTWNEGDVSTSVVRRVALPAVFYVAAIKAREATT